MKILVAGGAGYIGSVLVPKLLERGHKVNVVDLLWFGNYLPKNVKILEKNIIDLHEKDLEGYDQVIFIAGLSNDPMAEYSPSTNFVENGSAPAYLAFIAKRSGVRRFIYASSCSIYGFTANDPYDETMPTVSNYPYGISKLQGEFASMQMKDKNFSVISLRQGTISGYSPRMRFDLIVNTMFRSAVSTGEIIVNNPAIWRPILAIQDAVSGYVKAVEANDKLSGIFNIASGNFTVGEVADYVKTAVKKYLDIDTEITIKHLQDYRNYKVSIRKIMDSLNYKPMHNIDSIVKDLVEHLESFNDFEDESYYNINTFKKLLSDK
jgi:nucleoside-diphosphate-sugar epimerase|tara:strand:- start:1298 stop:2260 length:963 start_codon:yes stop_codon:yes gene_type:complete